MKKIKYIIVFLLSIGLLNSCLIDNDTDVDDNNAGDNFFTFNVKQAALAGIADDSEYTFKIQLVLTGPSSKDITADLQAVIVADDASTAIEGTHYRIDNPNITLTKDNNYLAELEVTMLTLGIVTPLDASPILLLKVTNATGSDDVIADGKPMTITLNYACPSFLAGEYSVVTTGDDGSASYTDIVTEYGIGFYGTERVATWATFPSGFGVEFIDVCDVITVPLHDLGHYYSNEVWGHKPGFVDPVTGVITLYYTVSGGWGEYEGVYTPNF